MLHDDVIGNTLEPKNNIAYIVGDCYATLDNLSCVFSISEFTSAVIKHSLPAHRLWVIGQGLSRDDLRFLRLCEHHLDGIRFCFGSQNAVMPNNESLARSPCAEYEISNEHVTQEKAFEWHNFRFLNATRVQAELKITSLSESLFFAQDFLFTAARELTERACQSVVSDGVLVIKQASLQSFHRLFPLPIMVETQFTILHDNKRSIKSLTRFYQDYANVVEVKISFDLYSREQAREFYQTLAEKTVEHLSRKIENDV